MDSSQTKKDNGLINVPNKEALDLECPVCLEGHRNPPIYQCQNGHLICSRCIARPEITVCPSCRHELDKNNKIRNIVAEKMINHMPQPCKYEDKGCPERVFPAEKRELHEKECPCRALPKCPIVQSCRETVTFKDLLDHMKTAHPEVQPLGNRGTVRASKILQPGKTLTCKGNANVCWLPHVFESHGLLFFDKMLVKKGILYMWIYANATPEETKDFVCTIQILDTKDQNHSMTFKGKPVSVDKTVEDVIKEEENCLMLPVSLVDKQFWRIDNKLQFSMEVTKRAQKRKWSWF